MGIIDWLKGKSAPVPVVGAPRAEMDWRGFEDALTVAIENEVVAFAEQHRDELFYGFAIDCNAYYANILFCLNTPENLHESARHYAGSDDPDEIERQKEDLLWGLGDWKYHGFNLESRAWSRDVPMLDEFAELPNEADTEEFRVTCCKALLRAEAKGVFNALRRTADFRVACIDHDEDVHGGDRRLERVRAAL
jgi:hypothetical protein